MKTSYTASQSDPKLTVLVEVEKTGGEEHKNDDRARREEQSEKCFPHNYGKCRESATFSAMTCIFFFFDIRLQVFYNGVTIELMNGNGGDAYNICDIIINPTIDSNPRKGLGYRSVTI